MSIIWLAICGSAGVLARYGLSVVFQSIWTTVAINLLGSFLLGFLIHGGGHFSEDTKTAIGVGFLGGFTTFSTLTVQTVLEVDGGRTTVAVSYLAFTIVGGLTVAVIGFLAGKLFI